MPRASLLLSIALVLLAACQKEAAEAHKAPAPPQASPSMAAATAAPPPRIRRPAASGPFDCRELEKPAITEGAMTAETIELYPPGPGKKLVMSKVGVVVSFDRDDFLRAARCMKLELAIRHLEEETGQGPETSLYDAFQLSFVVAAMLDTGRATVRKEDEKAPRTSIVRDGWAEDGCDGHCRSLGRLYRLSEDDPSFFLRITDKSWNK